MSRAAIARALKAAKNKAGKASTTKNKPTPTARETAKAEMKAANRAKMEAKRAADKKAKGQALGKALKAKAADYKSMGGYDKALSTLSKAGAGGQLRGVGRPMSVDVAIYEAQKNIRRLAKAAGMSVKNWRRNNTSSKWVKQLYKEKPDMKKADALRGKKKP